MACWRTSRTTRRARSRSRRADPGEPVSLITGNVYLDQSDVTVGGVHGLALPRSYNSETARRGFVGAFGRGWTHAYEESLPALPGGAPYPKVVKLRRPDGAVTYFRDADGDGRYDGWRPARERSWVVRETNGYTRHFPDGRNETYAGDGRLTSITDEAAQATTLTWNGTQLQAVTDPGGRAITFTYSGNLVSSVSVGGVVQGTYAYEVDSYSGLQNLLSSVTYPDGSGYDFVHVGGYYGYGGTSLLTEVKDKTGRILERHAYDGGGRRITSELAEGRQKVSLSYGTMETVVTDGLGNETTYEWNRFHGVRYVTKRTGPCASCGSGDEETWEYDQGSGRLMKHTDADGIPTTYTYHADGAMATESRNGFTTTYTYEDGKVSAVSGTDGSLTTYDRTPDPVTGYEVLTVTEKVSATEDRTTVVRLDGRRQVSSVTDPRGKTTSLEYTTAGDLETVEDPLGQETTFTYDGLGRRTTVTDPLLHTTTTEYDDRGRVERVIRHDDTATEFTYDLGGRRSTVTDPKGRVTRYTYDDYGWLERVIDPALGETRYAYDVMGQLVGLTDAERRTTTFAYDEGGRVETVTYPGGAEEAFMYLPSGRLETRTDRKDVVTTYAYTDGRLTGKSYSDATPAVSYTYETPAQGPGRLKTAANGTDTLGWTYDLAGQVLTETSAKNASTVSYTYDPAGNRATLSLDATLFTSYDYDDAGRLWKIHRGANEFVFAYDEASRRTSMTYPNGVVTSYTYDELDRLLRIRAVNAQQQAITDFQYVYDDAGNRTRKSALDYAEDYRYDDLDRLVEVTRSGLPGHWLYAYDRVGNRLTEQIGDAVSSWTHNEKNQLLSRTGGGPLRFRGTVTEPSQVWVSGKPATLLPGNEFEATIPVTEGTNVIPVTAQDPSGNVKTRHYEVDVPALSATYTYDANGNLSTKIEDGHSWTYDWTAENQLARVLKDAVEQARLSYDPLGRRVEKVAGTATSAWTYDAEDSLREVLGTATTKHVHGPGIDEALAAEDGAGLNYSHADGLGSITKVTSPGGSVTLARQYDAWGNLLAGGEASGYAYTGREWDIDAELYYYRARYYDPQAGRFISDDPIRFVGGMNFHSYVDGNPVRWVDPYGLYHCTPGASCEFTPEMRTAVECFDTCTSRDTAITSGRRATPGRPNSSHERGEACDVGRNSNPDLSRETAQRCFLQCFPQGYGQEEQNSGPGTHFHFQRTTVPGGTPGFNDDIVPNDP